MALRNSPQPPTPRIPKGTFREKGSRGSAPGASASTADAADHPRGSAPSYDELSWAHEVSGVLTLPPSAPPAEVYPDLETALLAASDQLHRLPSSPELPPIADTYRRPK